MAELVCTEYGTYYDPEDPGERGYPGKVKRRSVTDEEVGILAALADEKRVLEIGTGLAVSTRALAMTAVSVVTVDPDPWVQDPGIPGVEFRRELPPKDVPFDMVFIDGNHMTESVVQDIESCRHIPLLVMHDTYLASVARAIELCGLVTQRIYTTACLLAVYTHK